MEMTSSSRCLLLFSFSALLIWSCSTPQDKGTKAMQDMTSVSNPADSILKKQPEKVVEYISKGVSAQGAAYNFELPVNGKPCKVEYWVVDGKPSRLSLRIFEGENETWPTFFIRNDTLQMVRFRSKDENESGPFALERMIYFIDGKIVYCEERRMNLQPGEIPGLLRMQPFGASTSTFAELEQGYKVYLDVLRPAVNDHWTNLKGTIEKN